jgi:hypothetical protein
MDSPYIPVDSWVYPAMLRIYSLGYMDHMFLGMRPWTRASVSSMLAELESQIADAETYGDEPAAEAQAEDIYESLIHELDYDTQKSCAIHEGNSRLESAYTVLRAISGTPLHDSYHLGSTIINDYGRPFENGLNHYSGLSGYAFASRFLLYARGEFQGAPSAGGYSTALAQALSDADEIPFIMQTLASPTIKRPFLSDQSPVLSTPGWSKRMHPPIF